MRGLLLAMFAATIAVLAIDAIVPSLGLGLAAGNRPVVEQSTPAQVVDRTHKGDRLRMPASIGQRLSPAITPEVLIGCEPVFSSLSAHSRVNYAGRCMA